MTFHYQDIAGDEERDDEIDDDISDILSLISD